MAVIENVDWDFVANCLLQTSGGDSGSKKLGNSRSY